MAQGRAGAAPSGGVKARGGRPDPAGSPPSGGCHVAAPPALGRRAALQARRRARCWPRVAAGALLALAASWACGAAQPPRFDFRSTPGRLDKGVVPQAQALVFDLDPARERFQGRTEIVLALQGERPSLLLHAARLDPGPALLIEAGGAHRPLRVLADPAAQTWRLIPDDGAPLPAGTHRLQLQWEGPVQRAGQGLFRAEDRSGPMLATQLQAVFARQLFPGFDEPAFRVAYTVEMRVPAALRALSNMPVQAEEPVPGTDGAWRAHRFAPTPPMPAYLLALAVGPFEFLEGRLRQGDGELPLRIVTMPGKSAQGQFALQATQALMPYFAQRFGQPYPLPKLDQLAVPSTRFGAMEDWGLVSYVEGGLLLDPARDGVQRAQRVHHLVAHELAHQWFGNLVTAASWEEIWLNEAFATWLADEATDHFHPEWQWRLRSRSQLDRVLALDAGDATRAIRGTAVDEQQVFQVFDGITYAKGGAVLSMLQQWLGREVFDRGLQRYMAARRLSNATAGDLWHHLGQAAGRDVGAVAATWTDRPGHPLLTVQQHCRGTGAAARSVITVSQQRWRMDQPSAPQAGGPERAPWRVPVVLGRGDERHVHLLTAHRERLELPGCDPGRPWFANAGGTGFYRVRHDAGTHAALAAGFADLAPVDRLTLLSDTLALVQAGVRPLQDWVALTEQVPRLPAAHQPEAWRAVIGGWQWFIRAAGDGPLGQALRVRAQRQLAPELQRLGWTPVPQETAAEASLRQALMAALARWGDTALQAQAARRVRDELEGRGALPPATRQALFDAAGAGADAGLYALLLRAAREAPSSAERQLLLDALSAAQDPALAAQTLTLSLQGVFPPAEAMGLPGRVARLSPHAELAYAYAVTHFDALLALQEGAGWGERERLLPDIAVHLTADDAAERVLRDQARQAGAGGAVNARRAAHQLASYGRWRARQDQTVWRQGGASGSAGR
jgi:aminopeptidase N